MKLRVWMLVVVWLGTPLISLSRSVPPPALLQDPAIKSLPPSAFSQLPRSIVRYLQSRRCRIPQYWLNRAPHNVISGAFARRGQRDWAVLCYASGYSSVLVFWKGSVGAVAEIARVKEEDRDGYGRAISAVGRDYIVSHYEAYKQPDTPKPPTIRHQGIDVGIMEKASTVHYYYRGKWLELQGAD